MEQFLHTIIKQAGDLALSYFNTEISVSEKEHQFDILTEADTAVNAFITNAIKETYPDHAIKSEEEDFITGNSEYEWLVDPIDGTWNFAHQYPVWAVMICLLKDGNTVLSAVYFPVSRQLFFANAAGAFLNQKQVHIPKNDICLKKSVGKVGVSTYNHKKSYQQYRSAYQKIVALGETQIRTAGAACELLYMLFGNIHYALSNGGKDHDHLPTMYILEQAGAIISNNTGTVYTRGDEAYIIASTQSLHDELVTLLNE